ncbi:MAG: zinc-ribbon domain-containing protein [Campylobacterota bacterium]|nr:zinc-ribbon domain-containing protein [Campylobacterota bacterium]
MGKMDKCTTCGKMISINANSCPHCGEPDPTKGKRGRDTQRILKQKLITLAILIVGVIFLFKVALPNLTNDITNLKSFKVQE